MILAHALVGVLPVQNNEFSWWWFLGSIAPDVDHFFVLAGKKIFSPKKVVDALRFEDKYGIKMKTEYMHSVFGGAVISGLILAFVGWPSAVYFFGAYILHLVLDWPDQDEKRYLYPLKTKFQGSLPIFSKTEIVFTAALSFFLIFVYFFI